MTAFSEVPGDFDVFGLFDVVDAQRIERGMTWSGLNRELAWMGLGALQRMRERGVASCQHVLPVIQWVGRTPESFTVGGDSVEGELLPDPRPGRWRWYWHMTELADAVEARRVEQELSIAELATVLGSAPGEVKSLRTTKYGTTISFAMRCARWLDRSAASFLWEHDGRGLPWSGRRL